MIRTGPKRRRYRSRDKTSTSPGRWGATVGNFRREREAALKRAADLGIEYNGGWRLSGRKVGRS